VFLLNAPITGIREVGRAMFVISMEAPEVAATVRAGQFVNLGWAGAFLRRPFSVYRVEGERIEIVLKAVGKGTSQLIAMRPGDSVRWATASGSSLGCGALCW
jgi:dihydroorotate dehydrogenase electron transfer subunit